MADVTPEAFESWAVIEIMGHDRYAGRVTERAIGGCSFVQIDVPAVNGREGYTKLFGSAAIFSITPCTEEVAKAVAERIEHRGISPVGLPNSHPPQTAAIAHDDLDDLDDDDDMFQGHDRL